MKKTLAILLALILLLSACGSGDGSGQIIRYDIPVGVSNLDPQFAVDATARMIISNTFEGLFRQLPSGEVVPCLAKSYETSPDGLTYTFYLREDAKWSKIKGVWEEDTPVTAHDFVFAIRRLFDATASSPYASDFLCIKNASAVLSGALKATALGVSAPEDYTLQIQLDTPNRLLPELLASTSAMPCNEEFFLSTKARYGMDLKSLLFNGPFYIKSWGETDYITLRQNTNYSSQDPVIAGGVNFYINREGAKSSSSSAQEGDAWADTPTRFLQGKVDASKIDYENLSQITDQGGDYDAFDDTVWVIVFNGEMEYLANEEVRKALTYSVDRSLFSGYVPGNMMTAQVLVPPAVSAMGGNYRQYAGLISPVIYSPEIAKRYLVSAMEDLGISQLPFNDLLVCDENNLPLLAGFVQQNWQRYLSLYTGLTVLPREEVLERVALGEFQAALIPLSASYASPSSVLSYFKTGSVLNQFSYSNEEVDRLLEKTASSDGQTAFEIYKQAEDAVLLDGAAIPLFFETTYYAMAPQVSGVEFSPFLPGVYFKYAKKSD